MTISHLTLRQAVVDGANFLVRVGAISMSHHGNFSVRVPNTDTILLTATSSFDNLKPENLALLDSGRPAFGRGNQPDQRRDRSHARCRLQAAARDRRGGPHPFHLCDELRAGEPIHRLLIRGAGALGYDRWCAPGALWAARLRCVSR